MLMMDLPLSMQMENLINSLVYKCNPEAVTVMPEACFKKKEIGKNSKSKKKEKSPNNKVLEYNNKNKSRIIFQL